MMKIEEKAYAKINLSLDVLGVRSDGYHEMRMVMQSISLCDTVSITPTDSGEVRVKSNFRFLPSDGRNIAVKAAKAFFAAAGMEERGLNIVLEKKIPVCAGMGGGSSDAAAVLRGLNRLYDRPFTAEQLEDISRTLGSDVPFCVRGGTQLATGRGDELKRLPPMPECPIVVCKPGFSISTPELFKQLGGKKCAVHPDTDGIIAALEKGELAGVARRMYNVFEDILPRRYEGIFEIKRRLLDGGAVGTIMTGTGSAVFGIFDSADAAAAAREEISHRWRDCFAAIPSAALEM